MERDEFIKYLEMSGFSKSISGDMSKENEYVSQQLKVTVMDNGWVLSKLNITLYGKDGYFYTYIDERQGFNTTEFFNVLTEYKE